MVGNLNRFENRFKCNGRIDLKIDAIELNLSLITKILTIIFIATTPDKNVQYVIY